MKKVTDLRKWHKWFAWYPIEIRNNIFWLKTVMRIADESSYDSEGGYIWRYLTKESHEIERIKSHLSGYVCGTFCFEQSFKCIFFKTILLCSWVPFYILFLSWVYH